MMIRISKGETPLSEFEYEFSDQASPWLDASGPQSDIVISSRVRLARNLSGFPFLSMASMAEQRQIIDLCANRFQQLSDDVPSWVFDLSETASTDRDIFLERRLISRQHANAAHPRALVITPDESMAVMVNEEDHIRYQVMRSGLQLESALEQANRIDDLVEAQLPYAYQAQIGYLTACPTNVGTGIRVSVMLHLPALTMTGEIDKLRQASRDMHLAVRGCHGEGSKAIGDLYQVSNQTTLGRSETEILEDFSLVIIPEMIAFEMAARETLLREKPYLIEDRVYRSYATLKEARMMGADEVIALLSDVRMGIGLELLPSLQLSTLNELMVLTQPAHLQRLADQFLDEEQQCQFRANLVRIKLMGTTGE